MTFLGALADESSKEFLVVVGIDGSAKELPVFGTPAAHFSVAAKVIEVAKELRTVRIRVIVWRQISFAGESLKTLYISMLGQIRRYGRS